MFGNVVNLFNQQPLENVHIINLSSSKGTISNYRGEFKITVAENDTLYFSEIGYHAKKIIVMKHMLKENNTIKLITKNYKLDEIIVTPYNLTGILEIDVKNIVLSRNRKVVKIKGLKTSEQLGDNLHDKPTVIQPVDFIYNIFGSKPKELKKLNKLKDQDIIKNLLYYKYDREFLTETLGLSRMQIETVLKHCNYSQEYILKANDLQILEAILKCNDEYKKFNTSEMQITD
ncbi:MAG: carboxypeptidase-like regulatory domain-containing protein [Ichthyobacteriaceae bacterium]|nr:carboxypeptidase-like regulatory domain-containing protein [Ichthyobacteriaceae bacterium]